MKNTNTVTVIDYGVGNIHSVVSAIKKCGAKVKLTNSPSEIAQADRLVLPGVGAFRDGMNGLKEKLLIDPIKVFIKRDRPFLGICLGMQMMLDISYEFGEHEGLGSIPGKVISIPKTTLDGDLHKIPHIGWNNLKPYNEESDWKGTIIQDIKPGESVYFLHSFQAKTIEKAHTLAYCDYNGRSLSALIFSENIYGCQFHPEKSGPVGLKIMNSFCNSNNI
jgi:glutamine amidotransferase